MSALVAWIVSEPEAPSGLAVTRLMPLAKGSSIGVENQVDQNPACPFDERCR